MERVLEKHVWKKCDCFLVMMLLQQNNFISLLFSPSWVYVLTALIQISDSTWTVILYLAGDTLFSLSFPLVTCVIAVEWLFKEWCVWRIGCIIRVHDLWSTGAESDNSEQDAGRAWWIIKPLNQALRFTSKCMCTSFWTAISSYSPNVLQWKCKCFFSPITFSIL